MRPTLILIICLIGLSAHANTPEREALVREAAGRLDDILRLVAQSIEAVGEEYSRTPNADLRAPWRRSYETAKMIGYMHGEPMQLEYQSQHPSYYHYLPPGQEQPVYIPQSLARLRQVTPVVRVAYQSFDFSWVYLTTADNCMLIYPYLKPEEAINNYPPTEQIFYTVAANLDRSETAWTSPYLDLVGAGLMVTVSTPVRDQQGRLEGVASRDITLKQLTEQVLNNLVVDTPAQAILVDGNGMAIDATDQAMEQELQTVNTQHGAAVLHYLPPAQLQEEAIEGAVASEFAWANKASAYILTNSAQGTDIIHIHVDGQQILAAEIPTTNWKLIMAFDSN